MSPRKKPEPRAAPAGRDESVPLTASELAVANKAACSVRTPVGGNILREPSDNAIGPFKILTRIDGLTVAHDTRVKDKGSMGSGLVFWTEKGARAWAKRETSEVPKR